MMKANDRVRFEGRKATVTAIREDGTVSLLMADTGRMKRIDAKLAVKLTVGWTK